MKYRVTLLVILVAAALAPGPQSFASRSLVSVTPRGDLGVLSSASMRLSDRSRPGVLRWLRAQHRVRSAALGRDGRTLDIRFRDGFRAIIVPRRAALVTLSPGVRQQGLRPMAHPFQTAHGRAVVLEPFSADFGGPNIGDVEVSDLQTAGFQVDQAYDQQVTVSVMQNLTQYNVVYMNTHSGTDAAGNGVVVTGERAGTSDPAVQPLLADGSVVVSGVYGSTQQYYGVTTRFVTGHMGSFPHSSFLFINGCALLPTNFWSGLQARGAGALISWDNDAYVTDEYFSAAAFFQFMDQGQSISAAISSTLSAGAGTSTYQGVTARLGFQGDGSITLQSAGGSPVAQPSPTSPPPPANPTATSTTVVPHPPTATSTSIPPVSTVRPTATQTPVPPATATPTRTPVPPTATPTATSRPPVLRPAVAVKTHELGPGARQVISISGLHPDTTLHIVVQFPNGEALHQTATTDGAGNARFTFLQPTSKVTRESRRATITVSTDEPGSAQTMHYLIDYAAIDVSVEPKTQTAGKTEDIFVHSRPRTTVHVLVRLGKGKRFSGKTGAAGWAHFQFKLPNNLVAGREVRVRAEVTLRGHLDHTSTFLTVA